MNRIALVEDHDRLAALIAQALTTAGIEVDVFSRIESAFASIVQKKYATAVIDRGLPDGDGIDLVRRLRRSGSTIPCLLLTARDSIHDRVDGLEAGADDYLSKPFAMQEMVARVRALTRRTQNLQSLDPEFAGLQVRPEAGCMTWADESITLATSELQIMVALVRAGGQTLKRSKLEDAAWGIGEPVTPNALDVALHRLRRKLQGIGSELQIVNIRGHGFALRQIP
ncbi:response regulator transcription factor [Paucibacter sp. R3-3]|uniref:Response regulator transcription factor n=1 Tax=Roseateles agri TaxID=3098619 RepID=A0ABU5DA80_9BURK|nr:response regulator transcription factor [Paucibacter sp. R3-3]MDY0743183.1 response regulator transcription factor [Paucibacter sp. R3-3]